MKPGLPKNEFNTYIRNTCYIISQVSIFNCYLAWLGVWIFLIESDIT